MNLLLCQITLKQSLSEMEPKEMTTAVVTERLTMVEVGEGGWKNETKREVLLPTQLSHFMEKLRQAKAYCSGKCIEFRLHSCCVSEPCETIVLLHHGDSLHLFPLGASCKASFLLSGKEG